MDKDLEFLDKKVSKLRDIIINYKNSGEIEEEKFYERLCDVLSWCEMNIKKISYKKVEECRIEFIEGIKYANNVRKHSQKLYRFDNIKRAIYPSKNLYPSEKLFPSKNDIYWNKLKFEKDSRFQQFKCYKKYIFNRDILSTIDEIVEIIKDELCNNTK